MLRNFLQDYLTGKSISAILNYTKYVVVFDFPRQLKYNYLLPQRYKEYLLHLKAVLKAIVLNKFQQCFFRCIKLLIKFSKINYKNTITNFVFYSIASMNKRHSHQNYDKVITQ